jgi:hypothetical protein
METAVQTLVERVEELIPTTDRERVWGDPLMSMTPISLSIHELGVRIEALEEAVREIACEVQRLSAEE